jgi:hypothetical protein
VIRLLRAIAAYVPDALALAGLGLIAYGASRIPEPWGPVLAPIVLGLGLLAAVRYGAR